MGHLPRLALLLLLGFAAAPAFSADFRLLRIGGFHLKWGAPVYGEAAEVSYGFATQAEHFADAINCRDMTPIALLSRAWGDDGARLERIAADAFAMWSEVADIELRRARPGERPDILIGTQGAPRHIAFANVWHDREAAADGIAPLTRATICFNPAMPWVTEHADASGAALDLRTVLAHEIGHAIGLDHPGATGALMGYQTQGTLDHLLPGDIAGARTLYGPRRPLAHLKRQ